MWKSLKIVLTSKIFQASEKKKNPVSWSRGLLVVFFLFYFESSLSSCIIFCFPALLIADRLHLSFVYPSIWSTFSVHVPLTLCLNVSCVSVQVLTSCFPCVFGTFLCLFPGLCLFLYFWFLPASLWKCFPNLNLTFACLKILLAFCSFLCSPSILDE